MSTLTWLLDLSRQSLMADQAALNVTANNVANQNTPGYTREVVNWQPIDAVTISGSATGAATNAVSQRDRVLEQRVQQQMQVQAQSGALESALQQVQNIFGLSSTAATASTTALGSAMDSYSGACLLCPAILPIHRHGRKCCPLRTPWLLLEILLLSSSLRSLPVSINRLAPLLVR